MSIVKLEIINDTLVKWIKVLLKMNGFIPRVDFISKSDIDGLEVICDYPSWYLFVQLQAIWNYSPQSQVFLLSFL